MRYKLPTACLKNLYFATVYPHNQYGIELYANTNRSYIQDLAVLNNKLLIILQYKSNTSNASELYVDFNTIQIEDLRAFKLYSLIHQITVSINTMSNSN